MRMRAALAYTWTLTHDLHYQRLLARASSSHTCMHDTCTDLQSTVHVTDHRRVVSPRCVGLGQTLRCATEPKLANFHCGRTSSRSRLAALLNKFLVCTQPLSVPCNYRPSHMNFRFHEPLLEASPATAAVTCTSIKLTCMHLLLKI